MTTEAVAIVGLKRELKAVRGTVREEDQNTRWRNVAHTLRKIAALDEEKFRICCSRNLYLVTCE
jgi:hypothetical protein